MYSAATCVEVTALSEQASKMASPSHADTLLLDGRMKGTHDASWVSHNPPVASQRLWLNWRVNSVTFAENLCSRRCSNNSVVESTSTKDEEGDAAVGGGCACGEDCDCDDNCSSSSGSDAAVPSLRGVHTVSQNTPGWLLVSSTGECAAVR